MEEKHMFKRVEKLIFDPHPHRSIAKQLVNRFRLGNYDWRVLRGAVERPHYGYCVYQGARLAKRLGHKRISVIEFGVAGGNGLLNLEYHADQASKSLGISIEVYGFDTGEGLPQPTDYRDLPYHWKGGFYRMDYGKLHKMLRFAKLLIGDVRQAPERFFDDYDPAPIAAVMHDLDLYSSTAAALRFFDADEKYLLPRVFNYFDDIIGTDIELYNDFTGERLAINEFNATHVQTKLCPAYHLLCEQVVEPWYNQIFILHSFAHSRYNDFVSDENQQSPIKA
jgi:hypothetical protein